MMRRTQEGGAGRTHQAYPTTLQANRPKRTEFLCQLLKWQLQLLRLQRKKAPGALPVLSSAGLPQQRIPGQLGGHGRLASIQLFSTRRSRELHAPMAPAPLRAFGEKNAPGVSQNWTVKKYLKRLRSLLIHGHLKVARVKVLSSLNKLEKNEVLLHLCGVLVTVHRCT